MFAEPILKRSVVAFALAGAAFPLAQSAHAAPIGGWKGEIFRWDISEDQPDLTWAIDSSDADVTALVQQSFQQWQDVSTAYVTFSQISEYESADIQVSVKDVLDNPYAAGLSYPFYGNGDATITSCELQVLSSVLQTTTTDVALQVFAHEIGHCLGLGHSVVEGAVMSYREPGPTLIDDDKMALSARYPTGDAAYPTGCAAPPLAFRRSTASLRVTLARAFGATGIPLLLMAAGVAIPGSRRPGKHRKSKTPR